MTRFYFRPTGRVTRYIAALGVAAGSATCTTQSSPTGCEIAAIKGVIRDTALLVSETADLKADYGIPDTGTPCFETTSWQSSNPSVAQIVDHGATATVTAIGPGRATITASPVAPGATITVTANSVASVAVTAPAGVFVGQTITATATLKNSHGTVLTDSRTVTWQSTPPSIATVVSSGTRSGTVTGVSPGGVTITATSEGVSGSTSVLVAAGAPVSSVTISGASTVQVGQTIRLTATAKDASGTVITGRTVTWQSSDATKASVVASPPADGVVSGVALGSTTITATVDGVNGTQVVTVTAPPVARVTVTPSSASLAPAQTTTLTAAAFDAAGNSITGLAVTWQTSAAAVATVTPTATGAATATVTAVAAGSATITATIGGQSGTSAITVTSGGGPPPTPRFAYALADQPSSASYTANAAFAFNSTGGTITITRSSIGTYQVTIAGQATPSGQSEAILVTAYGAAAPGNCKLTAAWSSGGSGTLVAPVSCYTQQGAPQDRAFTITLVGSDAATGRLAMAIADQQSTANYTPAKNFNSSGTPVTIQRTGTGDYTVTFPGDARPSGGSPEIVMITTVGSGSERCASAGTVPSTGFLSGATYAVHCVEAGTGTAADSKFAVLLLEKGRTGQRAAFAAPDGTTLTIAAGQTYSSSGGAVTMSALAEGRYDITFAGLGATTAVGRETIQLTQRTRSGTYCAVEGWRYAGASNANLVVTVACYHEDGSGFEEHDFRILILQ